MGFAVCFVVTQFCCAQPIRAAAADTVQPAQCPLAKGKCEASKRAPCSGGPQLVSDVPLLKKFTSPQHFQPAAAIAVATLPPAETVLVAGWWSVPTRTVQLRI